MTPEQRAAAERLAEGPRTSGELWGRAVVAFLRELLAEPVQEPVAWVPPAYFDKPMQQGFVIAPTKIAPGLVPLYAAPQQRVPLTDEAIEAILDGVDAAREAWKPLARAIERVITGKLT